MSRRLMMSVGMCVGMATGGCVGDAPPPPLTIDLAEVGHADSPYDAGYPYSLESVAGRIVVSTGSESHLPLLLESDGRFVSELGRIGSGPGEFMLPGRVLAGDSSVIIQDLSTRQLLIFSRDGAYLGNAARDTVALPPLSMVIPLPHDSLLISASIPTEASFGQPFHVLTRGGVVARSWGSRDRSFDAARREPDVRYLVRASDSTFWAARPDTYALQLWSISGSLIREVRPPERDFVDGAPVTGAIDRVPLPRRIAAIGLTPCGHPVVVIAKARDDWKPTSRPPDRGERGNRLPSEYRQYISQRIEVLDSLSGVVLAAGELHDVLISGFMADRSPFGFRSDSDGRQLPIWWHPIGSSLCQGAAP